MRLRWYLDLAFDGRACVGRVYQLAVEGKSAPGQVRQVGKWAAVGMLAAWDDTPLVGVAEGYGTRAAAMAAVADWYVELPRAITA